MKYIRKMFSLLIAIIMVLSLSSTALASDIGNTQEPESITYTSDAFFYDAETDEISVPAATASEDTNDPVVAMDDITLRFSANKNVATRAAQADYYDFNIKADLMSVSGGNFTWYFNLDVVNTLIDKPHTTLTAQLKASYTTKSGVYSNVGNSVYHEYVSNLDYAINYTWTSPAKTGYYKIAFVLTLHETGETQSSTGRTALLNRSGVEWLFSFSDTGKTLPMPRANWPKGATSTRPSNLADKYYAEYTEKTGITLDKSKYEVHHIRPLAYGGDNSYSNLIHLPKATHTLVTSWFAGY